MVYRHGGGEVMVGLDDLTGLFQPMIPRFIIYYAQQEPEILSTRQQTQIRTAAAFHTSQGLGGTMFCQYFSKIPKVHISKN